MKIFIILFLVVLTLVFIDSLLIERYAVRFPEVEIVSEKIPKEFDGYRIGVVSDLHYGFLSPAFWVEWVVKILNAKKVDLIVGVGDYVKKKKFDGELRKVWPMLLQLQAKDGVYFVNGNHDHWANHKLALALLENSGKSIRNRNISIIKNSQKIIIAGIGDFWEDETLIDTALQETDSQNFRIVVGHNPDSANRPHSEKVDLFISGHTHGGQVRIPFLELSPVLPVNDKNFDKGLKENRFGEKVFISGGLGWSILPVRFYCTSEVPILVLRSRP